MKSPRPVGLAMLGMGHFWRISQVSPSGSEGLDAMVLDWTPWYWTGCHDTGPGRITAERIMEVAEVDAQLIRNVGPASHGAMIVRSAPLSTTDPTKLNNSILVQICKACGIPCTTRSELQG